MQGCQWYHILPYIYQQLASLDGIKAQRGDHDADHWFQPKTNFYIRSSCLQGHRDTTLPVTSFQLWQQWWVCLHGWFSIKMNLEHHEIRAPGLGDMREGGSEGGGGGGVRKMSKERLEIKPHPRHFNGASLHINNSVHVCSVKSVSVRFSSSPLIAQAERVEIISIIPIICKRKYSHFSTRFAWTLAAESWTASQKCAWNKTDYFIRYRHTRLPQRARVLVHEYTRVSRHTFIRRSIISEFIQYHVSISRQDARQINVITAHAREVCSTNYLWYLKVMYPD